MKKSLVILLGVLALAPAVVLAQQADIDTSNAPSCAVLNNNLRYGSRDTSGDDVSVLQDFLNTKGYLNSQPTGFFGHMTFAAVQAFQSANAISPTGFVGVLTRAKIKSIDCNGSVSSSVPTIPTNPVTYTPPVPGSPTQSSVTVISPKQGDTFTVGNLIPITWGGSWSGNDTFRIQWGQPIGYGEKGGSIVTSLTQAQAGCAGYGKGVCGYSWTPTAPTGQGRDQVTVFINGSNDSGVSGSFSVASAPSPAGIVVNMPRGSDTLSLGNTYTIQWNGQSGTSYTLLLEDQNGSGKGTIGTNIYGSSYAWSVGAVSMESDRGNINQVVPSGTYKIQVMNTSTGSQSSDQPSGLFTIVSSSPTGGNNPPIVYCPAGFTQNGNACIVNQQPSPTSNAPKLTVTSPNGGEVYYVGQPITVTWSSNISGPSDVILMGYNGDSFTGKSYDFGFGNTPDNFSIVPDGTNQYTFTMTGYMLAQVGILSGGGTFKIKVSQQGSNNLYNEGMSASNFQILNTASSSWLQN
jgi:hypothetical protein